MKKVLLIIFTVFVLIVATYFADKATRAKVTNTVKMIKSTFFIANPQDFIIPGSVAALPAARQGHTSFGPCQSVFKPQDDAIHEAEVACKPSQTLDEDQAANE